MKKKPFVGKQKRVDDAAADEEKVETASIKFDKKQDIILEDANASTLMSVNMSKATNEVQKVNKVKIPHMIYEQLRWIVSRPQRPPNTKVSVKVDAQSYRDQDIRPPSAFKHRNADLLALADTGCQAV